MEIPEEFRLKHPYFRQDQSQLTSFENLIDKCPFLCSLGLNGFSSDELTFFNNANVQNRSITKLATRYTLPSIVGFDQTSKRLPSLKSLEIFPCTVRSDAVILDVPKFVLESLFACCDDDLLCEKKERLIIVSKK